MATHLVTGGAGFIGSSIAQRLLEQGETVRILDDFSSGRRENIESLSGRVEVVEGSIVDAEVVRRSVAGVEVVFHEAAIPSVPRSVENPQPTLLANVQGTTTVLDEARKAGVRRVISASSSSVYGDSAALPKAETMPAAPMSPYAVSKLAGEHLARVFASLYGVETLSLRYFNVFGPRQDPKSQYAAVIPRFITAAVTGHRPQVFGDGNQTRDFCYVENVVSANILAATTSNRLEGQVINVACGERISINQLLRFIAEEVGRPLVADYVSTRPGEVKDSLAAIGAAFQLVGYKPLVLVRDGLRRTLADLASRLASDGKAQVLSQSVGSGPRVELRD